MRPLALALALLAPPAWAADPAPAEEAETTETSEEPDTGTIWVEPPTEHQILDPLILARMRERLEAKTR